MAKHGVNTLARGAYAETLRQFASGRLTNFEFEDREVAIERRFGFDDGVHKVSSAVWHYYDDFREHRLNDAHEGLSKEERRELARYTLFLRTELPAPTEHLECCGSIQVWSSALIIVASAIAPLLMMAGLVLEGAAVFAGGIAAYWALRLRHPVQVAAASVRPSLLPVWPFSSQESLDGARRVAGYLGCKSGANS